MGEGFFLTPPPKTEIFSSGGTGDSGQTWSAVNDQETTMVKLSSAYSYPSSSSSTNYYNYYSGNSWAAAAGFLENDDDGVDTTLRLCPPGTIIHPNQNKSSIIHTDIDDGPTVFDPTPLRWCPPALHSSPPHQQKKMKYAPTSAAAGDDQHNKNKRSREQDATEASTSSGKKKKKNDEDQRPLVPIEEIGGLVRMVESEAVFLYKKTLQESDVKKHHHRLLITRRDRVIDFLEAEEAAVVDAGKRLGIVAVDSRGNVYHDLAFKKWPSSDAMVINSGWNDVVAANSATKGDVVEIWGYKQKQQQQGHCNLKSALAFNFRKKINDYRD